MSIPTHLIPRENIVSHGPRRLKPAQGIRLNPVTKIWEPKWAKKSPNPFDREKLKSGLLAAKNRAMPPEDRGFDPATYRPLSDHVLVRAAPLVTEEGGIFIAENQQKPGDWFEIVRIGSPATDFAVGDRVFIEDRAFRQELKYSAKEEYFVIKFRHIAAKLV